MPFDAPLAAFGVGVAMTCWLFRSFLTTTRGVSTVAPMISMAVSISSVLGFLQSVVIALYMNSLIVFDIFVVHSSFCFRCAA